MWHFILLSLLFCSFLQAEVEGQKITWLAPHALQQVLTDDIDFNVMLTFVEFYEVGMVMQNFILIFFLIIFLVRELGSDY